MPEALSGADRASLAAERGPVNMAISAAVILEAGESLTYDALCARIESRLHLVPRYRQRIQDGPLGLAGPVWVDDEDFDLRWHVRLARLPAPGDDRELADYIAREATRLMDRARPLWELHLVEGLSGGRVAVVPKMHHAMVDGMGAMGIGMILFDPSPEPGDSGPPQPWTARRYERRRHVAGMAMAPLQRGLELARESADALLEANPRGVAHDIRRATDLVRALALGGPSAPRTPLNHEISANRGFALAQAPLAGFKAAGRVAGGTVNDVILAAVTGMLADWLKAAGAGPRSLRHDPVALVPVSVRETGDAGAGNRISIVLVELPVRLSSPRKRIEAIHDRMQEIRHSAAVAAGSIKLDLSGFMPPLLGAVLSRVGGASTFNLVVSNVPGPQFPLYLCGARVLAVHPAVPLNPADQGLNVGVFSYAGEVCFGLMADRDLDPPVEFARDALLAAVAALPHPS